jgi:hypothetical protein
MDMSAPGRRWHGHARPKTTQPQVSLQEISDLREQVEALLAWAEEAPSGTWQVVDEERAFIASISELFGVCIPLDTFPSASRAASFLRVVALALQADEDHANLISTPSATSAERIPNNASPFSEAASA